MKFPRPTYSAVTSTLALVVAVSGSAYAATSLPKNSVGTAQLQKHAVTSAKIKPGAVGAKQLSSSYQDGLASSLTSAAQNGSPLLYSGGSSALGTITTTDGPIGSIQVGPAGDYMVEAILRVSGSVALYCGVNYVGGDGHPDLTNPDLGTGNAYLPLAGEITTYSANETLTISCHTNTGTVNLSGWEMNAFQVQLQ